MKKERYQRNNNYFCHYFGLNLELEETYIELAMVQEKLVASDVPMLTEIYEERTEKLLKRMDELQKKQEHIRDIIDLNPEELTRKILYKTYIDHEPYNVVAEELNISRSTLFRKIKEADRLAREQESGEHEGI